MAHSVRPSALQNRILAALSGKERQQLAPDLETVFLKRGEVLCEPGEALRHAYFPDTVLFSLRSLTERGESVEVGLLGYEGVLGIPILLGPRTMPFRATVQLAGSARRLLASRLREEFDRCGELHKLLLRSVHLQVVQLFQTSACSRFHTLRQRLCRWLLLADERDRELEGLRFTHEFLSEALGVNRSSLSEAAALLQKERLIQYKRGLITILDRQALVAAACGCYGILTNESNRLAKN
jgi:CRP-like cAMP-binding protein